MMHVQKNMLIQSNRFLFQSMFFFLTDHFTSEIWTECEIWQAITKQMKNIDKTVKDKYTAIWIHSETRYLWFFFSILIRFIIKITINMYFDSINYDKNDFKLISTLNWFWFINLHLFNNKCFILRILFVDMIGSIWENRCLVDGNIYLVIIHLSFLFCVLYTLLYEMVKLMKFLAKDFWRKRKVFNLFWSKNDEK